VGRADLLGDGVIRDPEIHKQALLDVLTFAQNEGFGVRWLVKSPLLGPKGNAEFLARRDVSGESVEAKSLIKNVIAYGPKNAVY
jgi:23S rRNA (cytidine1920-2'-O)/16S rRNA (cytidine1409-2'-O)-methyltransferase